MEKSEVAEGMVVEIVSSACYGGKLSPESFIGCIGTVEFFDDDEPSVKVYIDDSEETEDTGCWWYKPINLVPYDLGGNGE